MGRVELGLIIETEIFAWQQDDIQITQVARINNLPTNEKVEHSQNQ